MEKKTRSVMRMHVAVSVSQLYSIEPWHCKQLLST